MTLAGRLKYLVGGLRGTWQGDRRRSLGRRLGPSAPRWTARRRAAHLEARIVWILGSPRTGSSWLVSMLGSHRQAVVIDEPTIGVHLGALMTDYVSTRPRRVPPDQLRVNDLRADLKSYFFSRPYQSVWQPLLRDLLLGRFDAEASDLAIRASVEDPLVLIKEPVGSQGADVLLSATPKSRLIFLLRDGRDVIDSELDAFANGGWATEQISGFATSDENRLGFVNARAHAWLSRTLAVQRAYDAHSPTRRFLLRYEDLLDDTETYLVALAAWLGLETTPDRVAAITQRLAFERIDPAERGPGKFARAASPGLWRERLSDGEQALVADVAGAKLRELGYE